MILQHRIGLLVRLGEYMLSGDPGWQQAKEKAVNENVWFIPEFVEFAAKNIAQNFLEKDILEKWVAPYELPSINHKPQLVGIVMAGNIPLVGFHDFLCVFIAGHKAIIKPSSKDDALIRHLVETMISWNEEISGLAQFAGMLKNCDAYIATGSNNSAGYFEYYFKKYPHIIRRNRTSVAILTGKETPGDLEKLADDVYLYFGLGCRNVTKIYVPEHYDFIPLLTAFKKYDYLADYHKYRHNYDYNLAIHLLNKKFYMSNSSILLVEDTSLFSPISQLNYEFYSSENVLIESLKDNPAIQCIAGKNFVPMGKTQYPAIADYADGVDTLAFLSHL
ncbi:MAG: acyl-CoA reductase [Bacteroidota bacterium]|nr:acyl-CoA reductase [Bacteroidota bacterium]